jgi:FkbM family methyltransferase
MLNNEINFLKKHNVCINGVIHVGAHRGEEVDYYENVFNAKQAIFIEPNPDVFKELNFNLDNKKYYDIICHTYCYAVSDYNGVGKFNIIYGNDADFMTGNKGCSSLLELNVENINNSNNQNHFNLKNQIDVVVKKLDDILIENKHELSNFDFMNIDAQGVELQILKGSTNLLENGSIEAILIEATLEQPFYMNNSDFNEIKEYLKIFGFNYREIFWHSYGKWGDALFIKEK